MHGYGEVEFSHLDSIVMRRFSELLRSFQSNTRGNVALIFAVAIIPILGFVGAAVDYSIAARTRTKITAALDTAVLLATSKTETANTAAVAQADAVAMFNAQMATFGFAGTTPTITVTDTPTGRTATGTASSVVPTTFMRVMGFNSLTVNGSSSAQVGLRTSPPWSTRPRARAAARSPATIPIPTPA
jgi:Flp pilus assembly protein TadG